MFAAPLVQEDGKPATPVLYQEEIRMIKNEIKKECTVLIKPIDEHSLKEVIEMAPPIIHISCHGEPGFLQFEQY